MSLDFISHIKAMIIGNGPLPIDKFMELSIRHYYAVQQPFGAEGDFLTAPEISQMFGEMIAMWLAERWLTLDSPSFCIAELGPGRGIMMADILRACGQIPGCSEALQAVFMIERSESLRQVQRQILGERDELEEGKVHWIGHIEEIKGQGVAGQSECIFVLANEFFDALPVKQYVQENSQIREVCVGVQGTELALMLSEPINIPLNIMDGQLLEPSLARLGYLELMVSIMQQWQHYAGLIIDYGYTNPPYTSTIQAILRHQHVDFLRYAGQADITSLVDFGQLIKQLDAMHVLHNIYTQGEFLRHYGIMARAEHLLRSGAEREVVDRQITRLTNSQFMGELFKILEIFNSRR